MSTFYNFNPRYRANHVARRYLGKPGSCNLLIGSVKSDPKYEGPCSTQYTNYTQCLLQQEFNRIACRPDQNLVIQCEKTKLSKNTRQIQIFKNWRKNKGTVIGKAEEDELYMTEKDEPYQAEFEEESPLGKE